MYNYFEVLNAVAGFPLGLRCFRSPASWRRVYGAPMVCVWLPCDCRPLFAECFGRGWLADWPTGWLPGRPMWPRHAAACNQLIRPISGQLSGGGCQRRGWKGEKRNAKKSGVMESASWNSAVRLDGGSRTPRLVRLIDGIHVASIKRR